MPTCTATAKSTGAPCRNHALPGLTVCRIHGGATKAAKAKQKRELERTRAANLATRFGVPIDTTPQQALLDEVQRAAGMVAYYGAKVQALEADNPDTLVYGTTRQEARTGAEYGTTRVDEATPNMWLTLWNDERDRLVRVSAAAIKAGIEERRVQLAEQQGQLIASVIRRVLDRLHLTQAQQILVGEVVPAELRALAQGG
ncbi:hypothetical protein [Tessaracoccus palaemonis]|uniref:Uncharacterized protein n=1 Tax=Tessaracoccus palaemonis TaxID=2829499 RepID=A0ABX8SNG5_9ACTN|nr:hypothetical protein [Tessaracoccus palaemonis]QXT62744.1 hypothetical protein KDB89_13575 [Tessaracoccus palaemonis]